MGELFTGIIEEQGSIVSITAVSEKSIILTIRAHKILVDGNRGDSIAINGICLTVVDFTAGEFTVDVMPETMKATSLSTLEIGSTVNLERAMSAQGRFGGHFVSGHVDGIGEIIHKQQQENAIYFKVRIPEYDRKRIIEKGSIAVDGISLTIFQIEENIFTISIIPHTAAVTALGNKATGDVVNLEYDMIGKYVQKMLDTENVFINGRKDDNV